MKNRTTLMKDRTTLMLAGLGACATCLASPTDGLQLIDGEWKVYTGTDGLTEAQTFRNAILPADGGVWTLLPDVTTTTLNTMDATVGGIDFGDRNAQFNGRTRTCLQSTTVSGSKTLTFTGENAFIDGFVCGPAAVTFGSIHMAHYIFDTFANPVVVPEGSCLTLRGGSTKRFDNVSGAGRLRVDGGELVFRASADGALHGGDVELGCGNLAWKPPLAAGASAAVSLGNVSVSMPGTALTLDPSSGDSAELTIGSLALAPGSSLYLYGICKAAAGVGHRAKVRVTDASSLPIRDGVLDPTVMGLDDTTVDNGTRYHFLRADETDGLVEYVPTNTLADAAATDIALVGDDETLAASAQVKGLLVDRNEIYNRENRGASAPTLTIPAGLRLGLGDGVNPAALVVNVSTGYTGQTSSTIAGAGTIDFGRSEGFVYHGGSLAGTALNVAATLAGQNGIGFYGTRSGIEVNLKGAAGWSGPTRVGSGIRLVVEKANGLPSGGDVYVWDTGRGFAAQLVLCPTTTWNQNIHLAGFGYGGSVVNFGALNLNAGSHTFTGTITLERDAGISYVGSSTFSGPIVGPGKLVFGSVANALPVFKGAYAARGGLLLTQGRAAFDGSTVPGTGRVETMPETSLLFWNDTGATTEIPNAIDAQGTLAFRKADVSLTNAVRASALSLDRAQVAVKNLTVGSLVSHGPSAVNAADAASTLTFDAASDVATAAVLGDGAGRLSVVKTGSGTLTLTRPQNYTGPTAVKEGTLRLAGGLLSGPDVAFWLDETSLVAGEDHVVTEWRSKVGDVTFAVKGACQDVSFTGPMATNTINGRAVATFANVPAQNHFTALATPLSGPRATVRSCFLVYRASERFEDVCGLFGRYAAAHGNDFGLRKAQGSDRLAATTGFLTSGGYRQNGRETLAYTPGETTVLYMRLSDAGGQTLDAVAADSYASSWYMLGLRYYDHGTFDGDIAECIAFDRELSTDEAKAVENYLAKKWGVSDELYAGVPEPTARVLPESTALTVEEDAVLDLNGTSATVASLEGRGRIVNSGDAPATLTVTGASGFSGKIEGNVTVSASGSLAADIGAGATLRATGSLAIRPYAAPIIPTNGLALWCDAYETSSYSQSGNRLQGVWRSKAGRIAGLVGEGTGSDVYCDSGPKWYCMTYPGIQKTRRLVTTEAVSLRTVYICAQSDYQKAASAGGDMLLGIYGQDVGYRCTSDGTSITSVGNLPSAKSLTWNGSETIVHEPGKRFVFCCRYGRDLTTPIHGSPDMSVLGTQRLTVGFGAVNASFYAMYFEVIMYDRDVTDREDEQIRAYLTEKWITHFVESEQYYPYIRPTVTTAFDTQSSLLLANGATVDLSGAGAVSLASLGGYGTLLGDVTLTGSLVADAAGGTTLPLTTVDGNLAIGSGADAVAANCQKIAKVCHPVLSVTGTVTGDFDETSVTGVRPGRCDWSRKDNVWSVTRYGGLTIHVK